MWKTLLQSENIKPKCRVPKVHNHVTPYENIAAEREIAPYKQLYHFPVVCFSNSDVGNGLKKMKLSYGYEN